MTHEKYIMADTQVPPGQPAILESRGHRCDRVHTLHNSADQHKEICGIPARQCSSHAALQRIGEGDMDKSVQGAAKLISSRQGRNRRGTTAMKDPMGENYKFFVRWSRHSGNTPMRGLKAPHRGSQKQARHVPVIMAAREGGSKVSGISRRTNCNF